MESTGALSLAIAVAISTATLILLIRGAEIRLVLLGAALLMTLCAGRPLATLDNFGRGMVSSLVAPICSAMGFAAVLSATQCDRHLVRLLMAPLKRVPWLMLPGAIVAAYIVNAAIPSQAAAAAAIGPILVPLMMAAGIRGSRRRLIVARRLVWRRSIESRRPKRAGHCCRDRCACFDFDGPAASRRDWGHRHRRGCFCDSSSGTKM